MAALFLGELQTKSSSLATLVFKLLISSRGMGPGAKPLEASAACHFQIN